MSKELKLIPFIEQRTDTMDLIVRCVEIARKAPCTEENAQRVLGRCVMQCIEEAEEEYKEYSKPVDEYEPEDQPSYGYNGSVTP